MVKLTKKFIAGDKVFAKVRGYPAWPAKIEGVTEANTKNAKYNVFFYGTGETAVCKVEELFVYQENKDKFTKPLKRKIFHDGIEQLELEMKNDRGKAAFLEDLKESAAEASEKSPAESVPVAAPDSDMESGPLVIDEGDKKKPLKRKTLSSTPNNPDTPEVKKKRGRAKGGSSAGLEITPKQEQSANDSQGEETALPGKEIVSRSGRKIKPKRFADFSSSEETEVADKNENSTRSRGKTKLEESNENQASHLSSSMRKKTASTEKDDKKILAKDGAAQRKKYRLRWLRIEAQILQLDAQIKSNLGLDRADADKCLEAMDEMLALPIDPLMLKKHPHIVETVKRLRRYIGNLADWKLSEDQVTTFNQKAGQIRQKAEHIYNKFKAMFTIPAGQSFWQSFSDQVLHFKELTKDMPEEMMLSLMADPACPDGAIAPTESASTTEESSTIPPTATATITTPTAPTSTTAAVAGAAATTETNKESADEETAPRSAGSAVELAVK